MALGHNGLGGGGPSRTRHRLNVIPTAIALVLAAVLGASVGMVWQSSGLGDSDEAEGQDVLGAQPDQASSDDEDEAVAQAA